MLGVPGVNLTGKRKRKQSAKDRRSLREITAGRLYRSNRLRRCGKCQQEFFISSCLTVCYMVCGHRDLVFGNDGGAICISVTERRQLVFSHFDSLYNEVPSEQVSDGIFCKGICSLMKSRPTVSAWRQGRQGRRFLCVKSVCRV